MTARIERRLAAIMAADVAGYSRLMEQDEVGTFARLKRLREEVLEPVLARQGGRVVDLRGDGSLIEFGSAVAAVEAAVEIQRSIDDHEAERPEDERLRLRIGINLGEVIVDGEAIYGEGVNVAARIEGLCEPGGVWLSRAVHSQVRGKLDLGFAPARQHHVKNISEAVDTFRVTFDEARPAWRRPAARPRLRLLALAGLVGSVLLAGLLWFWPGELLAPRHAGLAVLPFTNLGGEATTGRLARGVAEDLVTDLTRFRDLEVFDRSADPIDGGSAEPGQLARELGVDFVLQGSVQREGDRLRITAQLVDARSEAQLWSERWDRPADDVFAVQAELAERVASELGGYGRIVEADRAVARRKPPASLSAYDLYLLGVEAKHRMTPASRAEAVRLLQEALRLDPGLARAWTALSWVHSMSAAGGVRAAPGVRTAALEAARRAVELDPMDAEAHAALGSALGALGDLEPARAAFAEAMQLNPSHGGVLAAYAGWASSFGETEAGAEAADRLVRLDPGYPAWAAGGIAFAYLVTGRFEDALQALARLPREARGPDHLVGEAVALAGLRRSAESEAVVAEALARFPDISAEALVNRPTFSDSDRERAVDAMRTIGFPTCARPGDLPRLKGLRRLPECEAERARQDAAIGH